MQVQTTKRFTVRLIGRRARGRRVAGSVLSELSAILVEAARGALRQRVEGRSTARSAPPEWLQRAAEFDLVGFEGSGTVFILEAPLLGEAAPSLFAGQEHFASLDSGDTAVNVMAEALLHAVDERIDSDFFDQPLLTTFRRFGHLLTAGFTSIELTNSAASSGAVVIDEDAVSALDRLIHATAQPQRARISGTLEKTRHSNRVFRLILKDGRMIKSIAEDTAAERMADFFGKDVVLSGSAVFRPSGRILRLDADAVEAAGPDAEVWATVPRPLFRIMDRPAFRQPQGPQSGINAIIGRWPGEESDAELAAALRELS